MVDKNLSLSQTKILRAFSKYHISPRKTFTLIIIIKNKFISIVSKPIKFILRSLTILIKNKFLRILIFLKFGERFDVKIIG